MKTTRPLLITVDLHDLLASLTLQWHSEAKTKACHSDTPTDTM